MRGGVLVRRLECYGESAARRDSDFQPSAAKHARAAMVVVCAYPAPRQTYEVPAGWSEPPVSRT
jgi:hypothetical protein